MMRTEQELLWRQIPTEVHISTDCALCPRLCELREELRKSHPDWHNAPVNGFGDMLSELMILGLAPGMKGANATGRPFTGDGAGNLLYETLLHFSLATGTYGAGALDDLTLTNCRIVNAVRCLPPQNKPNATEILNCNDFLRQEIRTMKNLRVILVLGQVAHQSLMNCFDVKISRHRFGHAKTFTFDFEGRTLQVINSYHCSRYNTQTRRLTTEMFRGVFVQALDIL